MRKIFLPLLALMLCWNTAFASILPATGVVEEFYAWTGLACQPAVVLCESLTIYDARGDQGGQAVDTLLYTGQAIPVLESWDGYAKIYYADGTKTGWVRNEYLKLDPAWYVCDEAMPVYAYPEAMAPRLAWLDEGTYLPILAEYEDGASIGGWVCVSLRGAAGWIRKTPADTADRTWYDPAMAAWLVRAELAAGGNIVPLSDQDALAVLSDLLTNVEDQGGMVAGCPFTAVLTLTTAEGKTIDLQLATDSCCVYRVDGRDYAYARHLSDPTEGSPSNQALFSLFGMDAQTLRVPYTFSEE